MGEPSLTEIQRQQADQLSNAYGSGIEDEKETRLHDLERMYAAAHGALVAFLNMLDQDTVENWSKSGKSVYQLDDRFILGRVTELIKTLREKAAAAGKSNEGKVEILQSQFADSNRQIDALTKELAQWQAKYDEIAQANENLSVQAAAQQQVQKKVEETAIEGERMTPSSMAAPLGQGLSEPIWMRDWREKGTFERDSQILRMIGETGVSRQPVMIKMAAQKLSLNSKNMALRDAIGRLNGEEGEKGLHFMEKIAGFEKQGADFGGALPAMFRISELGKQAYWLLTGQNAVECDYDRLLRRHKSPEHTYLNLVVKGILEDGGYQVLLDAPEILLPGGEKFEPDITAQEIASGKIIFIEVERDTNKDETYRIQKWRNLCAASNGQIYIFCDTNKFMKGSLISQVNEALSGLKYSSHFSSVEGINNHERGVNGSIWLKERLL